MATRYALERPARREKLIGMLAEGVSLDSAAEQIASQQTGTVTKQAISLFAQRHSAEIEARQKALAVAVASDWIADKQQRIRALAGLYQMLAAELEAYGPRVKEVRTIAEDGTQTTTRYGGGWIATQMRGILRDAAEELGQIERPSVNTNIQVNQFLVREYGVDNPGDV